ncbi:Iron manganese superoxide dismutases alpha hairpin domain [Trypanosoma vivax]|uniref:superoxide dismutase n=1 Tax=Trypanosoma vivax (strain Y486) TaxID=1055687 RepID=G0U995_TRYVY|nr:putative superoxide dismutase [Trypanosoma vivax]KAH8605149.1 Iron manganese superoxide dismutases alpha hairpin domain [Trypanosoma vivax]CCC54180.1 putative superoxide dismutase [Trypanosoma vivax Y486]
MRRATALSPCALPSISLTSLGVALQTSLRTGLVMHTPKADLVLGPFSFMEQYNEFRNRSGRVPDYNVEKYRDTYWRVDEYIRRAENYIRSQGFFFLPTLEFPWYKGCLPLLSSYQIRLHYGRHHREYVEKLNQLIEGTPLYGRNLDEIIKHSHGDESLIGVYNSAAQHYNHCFYWKCIQPYGSNIPPDLKAAVEQQYGSLEDFQKAFVDAALGLFGSGWVYWIYDKRAEKFDIVSLPNAGCPLTNSDAVALLCVDVWEHAYYVDYENNRAQFLSKYFDVVDWHWAERHWKRATGQEYYEMKFW